LERVEVEFQVDVCLRAGRSGLICGSCGGEWDVGDVSTSGNNSKVCREREELALEWELFDSESPEKSGQMDV
jgi:hypothetical protein